jgi:hypothetical protein
MYDIFTLNSLSSNLFILLLGFVSGNLFPTFCGEYLGKAYIFILISLESFNYFYYSTPFEISNDKKLRRQKLKSQNRTNRILIKEIPWIKKLILGFLSKVNFIQWQTTSVSKNELFYSASLFSAKIFRFWSLLPLPRSKKPLSEVKEVDTEINDKTKANNRTRLKIFLGQWFNFLSMKKNKPLRSLQNSLKIGFLFGLFVDAFKVGS